jgi:hypothetical protein
MGALDRTFSSALDLKEAGKLPSPPPITTTYPIITWAVVEDPRCLRHQRLVVVASPR